MPHDTLDYLFDVLASVAAALGLRWLKKRDRLETQLQQHTELLRGLGEAQDRLHADLYKTNRVVNRVYVERHPGAIPPLSEYSGADDHAPRDSDR